MIQQVRTGCNILAALVVQMSFSIPASAGERSTASLSVGDQLVRLAPGGEQMQCLVQ